MTIKRADGPRGGSEAIRAELSKRLHRQERMATLGGAPGLLEPVPVYHLPLEEARAGKPVRDATRVGWWYPVIGGLEPGVAMALEREGRVTYAGTTQGVLARRFYQASSFAEQELQSSHEEFEPRLFDVPALQLICLWLHGTKDYFIPMMDGQPPGSAPLQLLARLDERIASAVARRRVAPAGGRAAPESPTN